jgi:hypothetical protein
MERSEIAVRWSALMLGGIVLVSALWQPESSFCAVLFVRRAVADEQISFLGNA